MTTEEIANEIVKLAYERMNNELRYQNINSAIHAVNLEVMNILMSVMQYQKGE